MLLISHLHNLCCDSNKKTIYVNENNVSILGSSFFVGSFASRLQSGEFEQEKERMAKKTPLWLEDDETLPRFHCIF